ncbi:hypothetical protein CFP56_012228 [Quercus suber]|uniref:Uncharacterized protein n=1 Tax=Quercus suber TaxID=58331 RepID=A0AAW0M4H3_QUESU
MPRGKVQWKEERGQQRDSEIQIECPPSLCVCESFNELKSECTRDSVENGEQVDLDLLTLRVLKDLILFLPNKPSLPLTSEEKKLQYRFKPTWISFQRKRSNLGSSKPHTHCQLPNWNIKRKMFSQPTGIVDLELKASLLLVGFACVAPKIIARLKIISPMKPNLGISVASSIAVSNHFESMLLSAKKSPKPTPPRLIDGHSCQDLKLITHKRRKATKEAQIEPNPFTLKPITKTAFPEYH